MLTFTHQIGPGAYFALTFSAKPCERVRGFLKSYGMRWAPSPGSWWRGKATGSADIIAALRAVIDQTEGIRRPVGACWVCQSPEGFFRNRGAAAPLWCDACAARIDAEEKAAEAARQERHGKPGLFSQRAALEAMDRFDMQVEDKMRDACGL